jgi:hypothetical protein
MATAMAGATPSALAAQRAGPVPDSTFPAAWVGRWAGEVVTVSPPGSVRNRVPVVRDIAPEPQGGGWTWRTVFNGDTVNGVRPYRLVVRDAARGRYAVDEGNGLELEATWVAGTLISVFQVGGRVLESREEVRGDTLVQDLVWWSAVPSGRMRGAGANAEQGMEVLAYQVEGRQRMVMRRVR